MKATAITREFEQYLELTYGDQELPTEMRLHVHIAFIGGLYFAIGAAQNGDSPECMQLMQTLSDEGRRLLNELEGVLKYECN